MPRKPRVQTEGSIYHVLARGNNKEPIFKEEADYYFFLKSLLFRKQRYEFKILSYALLPNHFHLLIKTSEKASLSTIMKSFLTSYSMYVNRKHHRVGHLFQNRFKSFICLKDTYLISLISYIHQNPKRAGLVDDCSNYQFCSLPIYLSGRKSKLVDTNFITEFLEESFGRKGTVLIKKLS
jgi:REP element-mobilizing transposase RayT